MVNDKYVRGLRVVFEGMNKRGAVPAARKGNGERRVFGQKVCEFLI
jgi:hypothetical protein